MIVGERPGETEAEQGRPFVGRAGQEQNRYLTNEGMHDSQFYKTNVCKDYAPGNPDPTPADVARWTPTLMQEVALMRPRIILAVGRFAVRWFLGEDADMELVHGMPHRAGAFDPTRADRAPADCVIMPCFHPAFGFYDDEARTWIAWDYGRAVAAIRGKIPLDLVEDACAGRETYRDVGGEELREIVYESRVGDAFGIDTEGYPDAPWSVQVSLEPGTGYTLRCERPDFAAGARTIQELADSGIEVGIHNAMYDLEMTRAMGMDFFDARIFDSMYAAYIMRIEPQGLKPLAYRWCGMRMRSYDETVGESALERQIAYLSAILERAPWPRPDPRVEYENDGTTRLYTPQPVERRAEAILIDHYNGKREKDGSPIVAPRWRKVDRELRRMVEAVLGPMPRPSLADIPLADAVRYASRDPDATLRLRARLIPALKAQGLTSLMQDGMDVLPVFEEMQANGMPARRSHFVALGDRMWSEMCRIQSRISHRYCGGRPINPASGDQVAALMRRRGLVGEKRSKKTGKMSTGKKSIEHLRYTDEAMADVINWREHQKIRDAFCKPVLERIPEEAEIYPVRCTIKTTRVASRRISASDPNLTAIPVRHELGREVRDGYEAPEGELFGSWDLSQIEMRYMAHLSRDPLLCRLFTENRDVHAETAARIFGIKLEDVKEMDHRYPAKRAGFGIITNIQGGGLLDQLRMFGCKGWDIESCDRLIEEWLQVYKGVADFLEDCKREVRQTGMVRDIWGMPRYLPGVWSNDPKVAAEAERAASSMKIQGGAQGMIQKSMAWLKPYVRSMQQAGLNVHWCLQIHDEVILRFAEELWETLDPLVIEGLTQHTLQLIVPVKAKGSSAKTWGQLKG
jgi:uracil-DNA glycosylase family 4